MFDSVLQKNTLDQRRFGIGAILSIVGHGVLLAVVLWVSAAPRELMPEGPALTFFSALPEAPAPAPGPPGSPASSPEAAPAPATAKARPAVQRSATTTTLEVHALSPEAAKPETDAKLASDTVNSTAKMGDASSASGSGEQAGGPATGIGGSGTGTKGAPGGSGTGTGSNRPAARQVLPFGPGMTRPRLLSGRDPVYTREALLAKVSGLMIVKCVITTSGGLEGCRIVKGLPHMDAAALKAMSTRKYTPVMYQGRAVTVDYVFNIKLVLPGG